MEDNEPDVYLVNQVLRHCSFAYKLHVSADGAEAVAFLEDLEKDAECPDLALILLDLNLPKMDGREVLARIKEDPALKTIPIVILTTSDAELDIVTSYELHANCYLTKPVRLEEFENLVKSVNDFWLTKVKLLSASKA